MAEPQRTIKFPLLKLPYLPLKEAIKEMDIMDIYNFSKSFKIGEDLVKFMKLKTERMRVEAGFKGSWISFTPIGGLIRTPDQYFISKEENIPEYFLEDDTKEIRLVPDHVDSCVSMAMQMNKLFEIKKCEYMLTHLDVKPEEMIQFLSKIQADKCTSIEILNRSYVKGHNVQVMDKRVLDYLMENLSFNAEFHLDCLFPEGYKHENLLKFRRFHQNKASWLTMEDLKSLRIAGSFDFFHTNFHTNDIIEFLKFFVNCEEDVIERIGIHTADESSIFGDEILDQFVTRPFFHLQSGRQYHLIKVRNTENRKRVLAKVEFRIEGKLIELETVDVNGQYKVYFEILKLMEEEIALEKELRDIEELEEQIVDKPLNEEEIREELMERKEAIQEKLNNIRNKLVNLNDELL